MSSLAIRRERRKEKEEGGPAVVLYQVKGWDYGRKMRRRERLLFNVLLKNFFRLYKQLDISCLKLWPLYRVAAYVNTIGTRN